MFREFLLRAVCSMLVTVTFMCFINVNDFLIIAFKLRFCFSSHCWFKTSVELRENESSLKYKSYSFCIKKISLQGFYVEISGYNSKYLLSVSLVLCLDTVC